MSHPPLVRESEFVFRMEPVGRMRVPGRFIASQALLADMEDKVFQQVANVASLPGIVQASLAMPDAHSGYGFPIGGVAAFDPRKGGVISAGGVGFDIACGVRTLLTSLQEQDILPRRKELADALFRTIPAGVGRGGDLKLKVKELDAVLMGGAQWAVTRGYGSQADLDRIEEGGCMTGADPEKVSDEAKKRQLDEMGTLGSGNHYLEVQTVERIFDESAARAFGLAKGQALVSIHCGSRGLGHQIGTDYMKRMAQEVRKHGFDLPDRELACAPYFSDLGQDYLGAMRAGINCALANRQILSHMAREVFESLFGARLPLLYDVSHNTCKEEDHQLDGRRVRLLVHRKGATRSLGPGHPLLPADFKTSGQPVLVGGSMGTASYILAGRPGAAELAFSSANHGAGRVMSRSQAKKLHQGRELLRTLEHQGIYIRTPSLAGLAEEAPDAYKDVDNVVEVVERAGLADRVARLRPLVCVKG